MKTRTKTAIITTLIAVPALFLGPVIFPPADVGVEPTSAQIPFFLFLGLTDALLLGVGVSFLIFGLPVLRRSRRTQGPGHGRCTSPSVT